MTSKSGQELGDTRLYAVLGNRLMQGDREWNLPGDDGPGKWMPEIEGELKPWNNSYQLCRSPRELLEYMGPDIYLAEFEGEVIEGEKVLHARRVRLLAKTAWDAPAARLFALDCAERVLTVYEAIHPRDHRPRLGLEAARAFLDSKIDQTAFETAKKAAHGAQTDRRIDLEDLHWGSTFEAIQEDGKAGSPTWVSTQATKAVGHAVDGGRAGSGWSDAHAAGSAAHNAATALATGARVVLPDPDERKWQAARLLEYINGER